jgi:hypothetical protein
MVIFAPDADAQSALGSASRLLEGNPSRSASAPAAYKQRERWHPRPPSTCLIRPLASSPLGLAPSSTCYLPTPLILHYY